MRMLWFALFVAVLSLPAAADDLCSSGVVWNYCTLGDCAVNGPANWGTIGNGTWSECAGRTIPQSPAKIESRSFAGRGPLVLSYQSMTLSMKHNGHNVKTYPPAATPQSITFNNEPPIPLVEFHFHIPAEHRVPGMTNIVAEMHLVHQRTPDESPTAVAVFLQASDTSNALLEPIINGASHVVMCATRTESTSIELGELVPPSLAASFLEYNGSLTTPACTRVRWLLLTTPIPITREQLGRMNLFGATARPITTAKVDVACWPQGPGCERTK